LNFTFYLKVAFVYRNGSFHSTLAGALDPVVQVSENALMMKDHPHVFWGRTLCAIGPFGDFKT
jgi:hypothetical protein